MLTCMSCAADDGRPLFRANPKGEAGIWICEECRPIADDELADLVRVIDAARSEPR